MGGVGEVLALVVGAVVAGDLLDAIEESDFGSGGEQGEVSADGLRGNGVVVAVEADPECLGAAHRAAQAGIEAIGGQGQQLQPLAGVEDLGHAHRGIVGPRPGVGDFADPALEAGVAVGQASKALSRPERFAQKADGALDATLFVAAPDVAGAGLEAVVAGPFEVTRVKTDVVAAAFEHDRAQVIAEQLTRHAAEGLEGVLVAGKEVAQRLVEEQLGVEGS